MAQQWVQGEEISYAEARAVGALAGISHNSPESLERLLGMPFLDTLETLDFRALGALRSLAQDDRLEDILQHPALAGGITDEYTDIITLMGGSSSVSRAGYEFELLDTDRLVTVRRTVDLPLQDGVPFSVIWPGGTGTAAKAERTLEILIDAVTLFERLHGHTVPAAVRHSHGGRPDRRRRRGWRARHHQRGPAVPRQRGHPVARGGAYVLAVLAELDRGRGRHLHGPVLPEHAGRSAAAATEGMRQLRQHRAARGPRERRTVTPATTAWARDCSWTCTARWATTRSERRSAGSTPGCTTNALFARCGPSEGKGECYVRAAFVEYMPEHAAIAEENHQPAFPRCAVSRRALHRASPLTPHPPAVAGAPRARNP